MKTLRFQTASYKVGKTYWRLQILEDNDAIICPSLSASGEFERGTQYSTQYQYHDGRTWKNDTEHPRYDGNHTYNGLPKGLEVVYYSNESIIKFWTNQNNKKASPLMVEGEGAPQYTMFDLPKDTQLALL